MMWPFVAYTKRRPADYKKSWGEAMALATFAFLVSFVAYGIVPHQWLTWADNELNWRPDKFLHGPGEILKPRAEGGPFMPFTLTYLVLRDLIAVIIYGVLLGLNVWAWGYWNKRGETKAEVEVTSEFGRPLVREGS